MIQGGDVNGGTYFERIHARIDGSLSIQTILKIFLFFVPFRSFVRSLSITGNSIYGGVFADEGFLFSHDLPYLLTMANAGPNTNGAQFLITPKAAPWMDSKNVLFGEVVDGSKTIDRMNLAKTNRKDQPFEEILIQGSGDFADAPQL